MGDASIFLDESIGAPLRIAQVLGLTSTAFLAGKTFSQSVSTTPALLLAPAPLLAKQWQKMFSSDKLLAPAVVLFSGSVFSVLGYRGGNSTLGRLYIAAASLAAISVPYSLLALEPINKKLEEKAENLGKASITDAAAETGVTREETVHFLVDRWATVNLGRSLITGLAAVCATVAAVGHYGGVGFHMKSGAGRMGR